MCYEECNGHQSNVQSSKALGSVKWEINTAATLIQNRLFIASLLATYACAVLIWLHQYACKAITYTFLLLLHFQREKVVILQERVHDKHYLISFDTVSGHPV